ncbi:hypothetical protein E0H47_23145 [Rhizobium leguminosarum bv. viciae]|uniref:primase-helicase family protein n=1 Tax=Rhizobium leguminosarum TaxID=384 RepID=UPI0010386C09|nr:DUF5906 domain-containing protein [Rhizobium leguminosarum]TBZ36593.1 hypothetical protein E0H47_23145 [Rhizobium leguminosarum bv. viciae]
MSDHTAFIRDYLAATGSIHLVAIANDPLEGSGVSGRHFGTDWQSAADWATTENGKQRNIYFSVAHIRAGLDNKAKKTDIVGIRWAHVDIDPPKDNPSWDKQSAIADLIARGAPSMITDSGGGIQGFWILSESTDVATIEQINRGICDRFNADRCWNSDRVMRLPFLVNYPNAKKQALGRVPSMAALVQPFSGATYAPAALLTAFPASPDVVEHVEELPDGPCEGWTGPKDDAELIRLMLSSKGSNDALFGNKASFRDLWTADPEAMAKFYPSDTDDYGRSDADLALMAHLAFFSGRDGKRMERLFGMSALGKRDKWLARPDYRSMTIGRALKGSGAFYNVVRHAGPPPAGMALPALPGVSLTPTTWVTVADLVERFGFCPTRTRPVVPLVTTDPNAGMTFENFKKDHARFTIERGSNPADAWLYDHARISIEGLQMRPDRPRPRFTESGAVFVNTYQPPDHSQEGGDVSVGLSFFDHLLPDARERAWFLRWLAYKLRRPEIPGPGVVMVAHGVHGTGRGSLTNALLPALFGSQYVKKVELSDLTGRDGQGAFNEFASDSVIVTVDEASDEGASPRYAQRRKAYDALKSLVEPAPRRIRIRRKFGTIGDEMTNASYLICTNHRDAIAIPHDDRRFAILSNGVRMPDAFRFEFHAWVSDPANVAAFARYLNGLDVGDYSPFSDPISTEAKEDMADAALSDIDRAVADILSDNENLPAQCFTVAQVTAMIFQKLPWQEWRFPDEWEAVARKAITNVAFRVGIRNGTNWTIAHDQKAKVAVYARTSQMATHWRTRQGLSEEVKKNDGRVYVPPIRIAANVNLPGVKSA